MQNIDDGQLDSILSTAKPRTVPGSNRKEEIFDDLRGEWLASQRSAQTKRRYMVSGIAASIVAALALMLQMTPLNDSPAMVSPDATLVRSIGDNTLINGQAMEPLVAVDGKLQFATGDIISTGRNAALSIAWNAHGSLRVNSSSNVTLVNDEQVELARGEIYYDG